MTPNLSLDEFVGLAADHDVVPLTVRVMADRETPVSLFEKLVGDQPGFLLESLVGGEQWARWSFVGWDPLTTIRSHDGVTTASGSIDLELPDTDPLSVLEDVVGRHRTPGLDDLPPLHTGLVGYLGYDCVRYVEHLPDRPEDDRGLPEMVWQMVGSLAAIDAVRQEIVLVRNVVIGRDPAAQYRAALALLERTIERIGDPSPYRPQPSLGRGLPSLEGVSSSVSREDFEAAVDAARRYVRNGDAFQVVLSQRLGTEFNGSDFDVYRNLRHINPSPYLFFVRDEGVTVAGSSPELMTRVRDGVAFSRPIAGTRPRGATPEEDAALEEELLADPKERAEHVMLVDLARNDLGRVCEYGSVQVDDLMVIERYSHVLHIVSGVSGTVREGVGPVDVVRATFPHGTVSGAPKVRAMEIIDELEPIARGPYAGAVGYLDFSGNVDTAICLRTVVLADGQAWVQAGAGLVYDSDPTLEYEETMNKAAAALAAVQAARHG
ncbi:MAG: anthranilate synthase component I [Acidimicrobiia bacterium]|nr:MAG: anthranilate synthase component I [Acidimicrobiia bacterium]